MLPFHIGDKVTADAVVYDKNKFVIEKLENY
jgi:hypothetical protein